MALKRSSSPRTRNGTPHTPVPEQFVSVSGEDASNQRDRLNEQIARLQQRQMELVQETAAELESLKQQLSESQDMEEQVRRASQPLLLEIASLRSQVAALQQEKEAADTALSQAQDAYQQHYAHMHTALAALKNVIRGQARSFDQQVRSFSRDASETIEHMLGSVEAATIPPPELPAARPASQEVAPKPTPLVSMESVLAEFEQSFPEPAASQKAAVAPKEKPTRSFKGIKKFMLRTAVLGVLAVSGWGSLTLIRQRNLAGGEVAGASTTAEPTSNPGTGVAAENPAEKYKESYAILPFEQTEWQTYTDPDLGFSVRYPTNTTNLVKTIGGNNVWFLRFDSYLLKVSREDTTDTLEEWWNKSQGFYQDGNTVTTGTFRGRPARIVKPTELAKNSGTTYIFATKTGVMQVWVKDEDSLTDDGQRVARMVESFTVSN